MPKKRETTTLGRRGVFLHRFRPGNGRPDGASPIIRRKFCVFWHELAARPFVALHLCAILIVFFLTELCTFAVLFAALNHDCANNDSDSRQKYWRRLRTAMKNRPQVIVALVFGVLFLLVLCCLVIALPLVANRPITAFSANRDAKVTHRPDPNKSLLVYSTAAQHCKAKQQKEKSKKPPPPPSFHMSSPSGKTSSHYNHSRIVV